MPQVLSAPRNYFERTFGSTWVVFFSSRGWEEWAAKPRSRVKAPCWTHFTIPTHWHHLAIWCYRCIRYVQCYNLGGGWATSWSKHFTGQWGRPWALIGQLYVRSPGRTWEQNSTIQGLKDLPANQKGRLTLTNTSHGYVDIYRDTGRLRTPLQTGCELPC